MGCVKRARAALLMLQADVRPAVLSPSQIFNLLVFILQQTSPNLTTLRHKHSFILHPERRENIPADLPAQPFKGSFSSKIKQEAGKYIHKVFIVNGFKQENLRDETFASVYLFGFGGNATLMLPRKHSGLVTSDSSPPAVMDILVLSLQQVGPAGLCGEAGRIPAGVSGFVSPVLRCP